MQLSVDQTDSLIKQYAPYVFFHKNESAFPIDIDTYLTAITLTIDTVPVTTKYQPTNQDLYNCYLNKSTSAFMNLTDSNWTEKLQGDPKNTHCFAKIVDTDDYYAILYYYLFEKQNHIHAVVLGFL